MSDKFKPGDKVRVIGCKNVMHFIGYDTEGFAVCQSDKYWFKAYTRVCLELIPEPRKVSGWVRIHCNGSLDYDRVYLTKEFATHDGHYGAIYVSGTEGIEP